MNNRDDQAESLYQAWSALKAKQEGGVFKPGSWLLVGDGYRRELERIAPRRDSAEQDGAQGMLGQLAGMDVRYSPFVEHGTAIVVERTGRPFQPSPLTLEFERRFAESLFWDVRYGMPRPIVTPPVNWQRRDGESLLAWGDRLSKLGLLDKPAYRWQYQRAVLSLPLVFMRWLLRKVMVRYGNSIKTG
jgi:hypothetical protein